MDKEIEENWKEKLTPQEYRILREKGTEVPFSGKYDQHFESGIYRCKGCGAELFSSNTKVDSHLGPSGLAGWPSFEGSLPRAIEYKKDDSLGMNRTEVVCAKCGSHLGHIFEDETTKTGKHYCINSTCLDFDPTDDKKVD
jgi:peptide-methionine (R)-S-oxide reductase